MITKNALASLIMTLLYHITKSIPNSQFPLSLLNTRYGLQISVGSQNLPFDLVIDTVLSTSLINSNKCDLCAKSNIKNYDPTKSLNSKVLSPEASYKRRKFQYNGTTYEDSFQIVDKGNQKFSGANAFLSIVNISLTTSISESGYISLSYFSDLFKMINQKKIIALEFTDSNGLLRVGDIDPDVIDVAKLVYFPITVIEKEKIWYLHSKELTVKRINSSAVVFKDQKVMIDTTTWQLHIPRKFFFENIDSIIPLPCQVQLSGLFYCNCQTGISPYFPTYNFTIGGNIISVSPLHYVAFDSSNRACVVHININYYTDYWMLGLNYLSTNNTLIDYENNPPRIAFYTKAVPKKSDTTTFIIVFVSVAILSCLFFFGGYALYKKYFLQGPNNNEENNLINDD